MQGIGGELLLGTGRHRSFAVLSLAAAAANIVLSILLIGPLGLNGVAWGTTVPLMLLSLAYLPAATMRLVGGSPSEFARRVVAPALAAVVAPAALIIGTSGSIETYRQFAVYIVLTGVLYLPGAYLFGLTASERDKLKELRRLISRRFLS
jgi:O-antigen/teichoic acid export membrane protein